MATVSSFEGLARPNKSELRQFAELFMPLFQASSEEAKRQAVAALSQCTTMPQAVCLFVGSQSISIAAPFLVSSPAISDDTLIAIARTQGAEHGKAIVNRANLSPKVIDALVALRHAERRIAEKDQTLLVDDAAVHIDANRLGASMPRESRHLVSGHIPMAASIEQPAADIEEEMRLRLRDLAAHLGRQENDRLGLRNLSELQQALLVRFARSRDASYFATAVADALSTSHWLVRRIMLDISGRQLATTLTSLGMAFLDMVFVLERFYPHLADLQHGVSRAWMLLDSLDPEECDERVEAWRRADSYTYNPERSAEDRSSGEKAADTVQRVRKLASRSR